MPYTYSGALVRAAHYAQRPPPPGLARDHFTGETDPDMWDPNIAVPAAQAATVWPTPEEFAPLSNMPNLAQVPVSHWYAGLPPVPSSVPYEVAQQQMQDRMMPDHADSNYVPDSIRLYQHMSEGMTEDFVVGRMPQNAGVDPGENLEYLVNGKNSYDHTNQPNEVYAGDPANVGRYRLGVKTVMFGLYDYPLGKFGQDALVHAYTGLNPAFPLDKPPMTDTKPFTPNSTGTAHWQPTQPAQIPSNFPLPSETALTDFATIPAGAGGTDFQDDGRL